MRTVDLTKLVYFNNNKYINWKASIGCNIPFVYDDITGTLQVLDYQNGKAYIYYKNKTAWIYTISILKCQLGKFVKPKTEQFKYFVDDHIQNKNRNFIITDKKIQTEIINGRHHYFRFYKYHCLNCGWEDGWINEYNIDKGYGCSCCKGAVAVKGINTIGDKHPELKQYFIDPDFSYDYTKKSNKKVPLRCPICGYLKFMGVCELTKNRFTCDLCESIGVKRPDLVKYFVYSYEAYTYKCGSDHKVKVKCPDCNHIFEVKVSSLFYKGFICHECSDGISYPEKFIAELFKQAKINYKRQLSKKDFSWCDTYKYDFYLTDYNYIIEFHGMQHYETIGFWTMGGKTLDEEKNNDAKKELLAKQNNISNYIIIDCRYSNMSYIQQSLINSDLNKIINFSNINWNKCNEFATKSIIKEICIKWETNPTITISQLAKEYDMSRAGIRKYIKTGNEFGWCHYDINNSRQRHYLKQE